MTDASVNRPYACHKCHVSGVKLWRDYGTPFHWDLWCVDCACAADSDDRFDPAAVREDGTRVSDTHIIPKRPDGYDGLITGVASFKGHVTPDWLNVKEFELRLDETDQLGWYVPAVPSDGSKDAPNAYWGYTSTDSSDYEWWKAQPLRVPIPSREEVSR